MPVPNYAGEKDEPLNIKDDSTNEKYSVGAPKALATPVDSNQSEETQRQIYQQKTIEKST